MRITSGIMMRQYNSRLNDVLNNLNAANERVTTRRKYMKASENPSESVRSLQLRREYLKNDDYIANLQDTQSKFDCVESSMMKISKAAEDAYVDIIGIINGTNGANDRKIVASKLREIQKTMVMDANASYSGQFIFGGSSTKEIPFTIDETTGKVTYRNIDLNTSDSTEKAKLKDMADEKIYVDLGFGISFEPKPAGDPSNTIVEGSAYNTATPGIKFLGYGTDSNGNSNNIIVNLGKIADALENPNYSSSDLQPLTKKLEEQKNNVLISITQLGSNTLFLDYTAKRLDDVEFNLNKQIESTEFVNLEEAITDFKMQDTTYRAVLKMGMDILSVSFIDFMK